jgi:hypothetical protein
VVAVVSVAAVVRVMVPTRGDGGIFDHFGVFEPLVQTSQPDRNQQSADKGQKKLRWI